MEYLELICKNEEIDTEVLINELEEEQRRRKEFEEEMAQDLNKWIQYQTSDETEIIKDISKIYSMNLSDARDMLGTLPEEPVVDGKNIPDLIKEMRLIRRKLKGAQQQIQDLNNKLTKGLITEKKYYKELAKEEKLIEKIASKYDDIFSVFKSVNYRQPLRIDEIPSASIKAIKKQTEKLFGKN